MFNEEMNKKTKLIIETSKNKINSLNNANKIKKEFKNTKNEIYHIFEDVIIEARLTFLNKHIKNAIKEATIDKIKIKEFLGMYKGCLVVIFKHNYNILTFDVLINIKIEDIEFEYPFSLRIFAFGNGKLLNLKEAYDNKILKLDDIKTIRYLYSNKDKQKNIRDFK